MSWSRRRQWSVVVMLVALVALVAGLVALMTLAPWFARWDQRQVAGGAQWRAESDILVQRVEKLAAGGEIDAATSVLEVVLQRGDLVASGQGDRARMALARACLAGGRRDQALGQVQAIPWADKGPQVAAEIVGLELAVRWRGLFDDHLELVSGALTPCDSLDAPFGRAEGLWQDRWNQYRALAGSLDRGARMVMAEGGQVAMPATQELMQVARYSRGDGTLTALMASLGAPRQWSPELALTVMRLHLGEHDLDASAGAAEVLWTYHPDSPQAGTAFRELRLWQARRRAMATSLHLWEYPLIDQRLDQLVARYPAMAASAEAAFQQERAINQVAMTAGMTAVVEQKMEIARESTEVLREPGINPVSSLAAGKPEWRLALDYDGLSLRPEHPEVAAGSPVRLFLASDHRGEHQIRVYRLAGRAQWEAFSRSPTQEQLPATAVAEQTVELKDWLNIGTREERSLTIPDLAEGFYVATVCARGCPVVIMSGVTVVDPDLHLIAGRAELLAWVVRRATGQGKNGEPVVATVTLERSGERAAGAAWAAADPAWRSGFNEGFSGVASPDFKRADQQALFAQGVSAGSTAAAADPALSVELMGVSDASGLVRLPLPERLRGRSYRVTARIARPTVAVVRVATFGEDAAWTSKAVAWADKPLARPGESVRFKALLRDFNGDGYRLPMGELRARLRLDDAVLSDVALAISAHGTVSGEVLIPPGALDGELSLVLGDGSPHHLGRVERVRLPPVRYELSGLDTGLQVRAGESVPLTVRLRDRGGEPLAGIAVRLALSAHVDGVQIPCEAVPDSASDLAGEVHFAIPTAAGSEADYQAGITFIYDGVTYRAGHEWHTRTFPFQLDAALRQRDLRVGGMAQAELCLPIGAEVSLQFTRAGVALGAPVVAKGRWPAWTQVALGIDESHLGADALTISTSVLGGGTASRSLAVTVQARQAPDGVAQVALVPVRNRVETGEILPLALGISDPGRDLLVLGGARDLVFARVERLEQSSKPCDVTIAGTWAPNLFLSAIAYLPGSGFVTSERREVEVLPIDRLLTVTVTPSRTDLHPGEPVDAVVQVVDWHGQPAVDCTLSLGVVNDLLYQLAEDPTPDLWRYFHSYHRPWGLVDGRSEDLAFPHAMFWRSVIFRWQGVEGDAMFGQRMGGGSRRAISRCGGCRQTTMARALLQPEADGTIWWVADLRTDAQGRAVVHFPLPEHAGRFRCTARANDASAAVLVGEVRSMLASREPYACALDLPDVVAPGDVVPAQIQVANHEDQAQTLILTLPDGSTRELLLGAKARRTLTLPVTIPDTAIPAAEVVRLGSILGERLTLSISLTTPAMDARVVAVSATTLRRLPGHPFERQLQVVADAQGVVPLPLAIQPAAGMWVRLRAWPDGATRRAAALADWRQINDPEHVTRPVMGWLLAEPGAERRKRLAALWPKLGDDAAATVVKQAAMRRGEATIGINHVPTDAIGDWLLARGRAAGQALPSPRLRGIVGRTLVERVAGAATAVAEGWGEGRALWQAARQELLADPPADTVDVVALAIGCDAARLADDQAGGKRLAALLAQRPWSADLAAVLACELLPEQSEVRVNQVTLSTGHDGSAEVVLPASEFAEWSGIVGQEGGEGVRLRTRPGALVQLDLLVQQSIHQPADGQVTVDLWQEVGDGYERVAAGNPVGPGRRLVLVVDNTDGGMRQLTIALPSLLRLGQAEGEVFLIDRREDHWLFPDAEYHAAMAQVADDDRQGAIAVFAATLGRMTPVRSPIGRRVALMTDARKDAAIHGGALLFATTMGRQCLAFPVESLGEGSCRWPGARIDDGQQPDRTLRIAAIDQPPPATVRLGHPRLKELVAAAARCTADELAWLVGGSASRNDLASWDRALRILDPAATQELDELLQHPSLQRSGHWTQARIRRWVDGEPLLTAEAELISGIIATDQPTLASLIELAATSRELRRKAWFALPQPQPAPAAALVNLKRWYERLHQLHLIDAADYRAWCWQQELDADLIARLGYANTLDAWVAFVRQQLELPLRIGAGVRTGNTVSTWVTLASADHTGQVQQRVPRSDPGFGGSHLGSGGLGDDLVVVALDGAYEVRPFLPSPQPRPCELSFDYTEVPATEALDHLNLLLANRGLRPVRLAGDLTADERAALPPVTLHATDMAVGTAVKFLAGILDLKPVQDRDGIRLERSQ